MEQQPNAYEQWFSAAVQRAGGEQEATAPTRFHIQFPKSDPTKILWAGLRTILGTDTAKWLPCYVDVARWLHDNQSRGLICVGPCGVGKTLICTRILPILFSQYFGVGCRLLTAVEMNAQIDTLLEYCQPGHIIIIDDLGTEAPEAFVKYNRRHPFCELVDRAEHTGTLLIITTNLRTNMQRLSKDGPHGHHGDPAPHRIPSIEERYGLRTLDRLRATTKVVVFKGESMRT